ncbi:hypothetical protein U879_06835 [Defluviimonas sp. 20V17]|nr:hypothetical protein U879_06835 [Defluviimonas sp. 20V17]
MQIGHHRVDHRLLQVRGPPGPFRQHRTVELDPLAAIDVRAFAFFKGNRVEDLKIEAPDVPTLCSARPAWVKITR